MFNGKQKNMRKDIILMEGLICIRISDAFSMKFEYIKRKIISNISFCIKLKIRNLITKWCSIFETMEIKCPKKGSSSYLKTYNFSIKSFFYMLINKL